MGVVLFFITITFVCIAFLSSQPLPIVHPLLGYFAIESAGILHNLTIFGVTFLVLIVLFSRLEHMRKKYTFGKRYVLSVLHLSVLSILGFLLGFVALFLIAFVQLTISAILFTINPTILGIETNTQTIAQTIKANDTATEIIITKNDPYAQLIAIAWANSGKEGFYGSSILTSFPPFLIFPIQKPSSGTLLIDNTLIVTALYPEEMQAISPVVAQIFLKKYFWRRTIKAYPKLSILKKEEYLKYRKRDALVRLAKIDQTMQKIETNVSSISARLQEKKNTIVELQKEILETYHQRDTAYNLCLSQKTSSTDCKTILSKANITLKIEGSNIDKSTQQIAADTAQLEGYTYYKDFFTKQKKVLLSMNGNIAHELGVFEMPDHIKIVLSSTDSGGAVEYFETVLHEYLHFASFLPDRKLNDTFFEEGLTEYFAQIIIENNVHTKTNVGYPVQVKIIREMTKMIPESDLADIYFSKDQIALEKTLDRVYGDGFYNNNQILFETLQYSSDPKQTLKLANTILKQIGGKLLQTKDLMSALSN
jgi:hypothetical protein